MKNLFSIIGVPGVSLLKNAFLTIHLFRNKKTLEIKKNEVSQTSFSSDIDWWFFIEKTLPERFKNLPDRTFLSRLSSIRKKMIVSGTALYTEEDQKQLIADFIESGGELYVTQHGSNYGYARNFPLQAQVEFSHSGFLTWGWEKQSLYKGNFIPLPFPNLNHMKNKRNSSSSKLYFIGTAIQPLTNENMSIFQSLDRLNYRKDKKIFLNGLPENILKELRYRAYFDFPNLLDDEKYIKTFFPKTSFCRGDLHSQIQEANLVVLDNPGTTMHHCMAANIPTVLFWRKDRYLFTDAGIMLFEELKKVGILLESPEDAACKISDIYDDVDSWWNSDDVQKARLKWIEKYSFTKDNWYEDWKRFCLET